MERKRVCGIRCRNAKGKRCRCVCGGATHGKGMTELLEEHGFKEDETAYIEQKALPLPVA